MNIGTPTLEGLEGFTPEMRGYLPPRTCDSRNPQKGFQTLPTLPTQSTEALLDHCADLGIDLWVHDGKLLFDAPKGVIDATLRTALVEHKAELITALTPPAALLDCPLPPAEPRPDPFVRLRGPRRTPWGTLVWSDPSALPLELFGECP